MFQLSPYCLNWGRCQNVCQIDCLTSPTPYSESGTHMPSGVCPGREACDNTLKCLLLMDHAQTAKIRACLLYVDAEKAFKHVGWLILEQTLVQIGLRPALLRKIMALYAKPSAKIRINQSLTLSFSIQNGTRQGCLLSPFLLILVMEHLVAALRQNPLITGIPIDGCQVT